VWTVGALLQGRLTVGWALMLWAAVLATLSSAMGWMPMHYVAKPVVMVIAIISVAPYAFSNWSAGQNIFEIEVKKSFNTACKLLLAALGFSLIGDVLLMLQGYFVFGLLAFLCTHLAYIALFKRGVAWFPHRGALLGTLTYGCVMYAILFNHLPGGLRLPVAAYVLVIALMGAQAVGRALVLRDAASRNVAIGVLFFMASDTLLAINRFVTPLPVSALWVLSSYYRSGSGCLNNKPRFISGVRAVSQRCRVVHGGGACDVPTRWATRGAPLTLYSTQPVPVWA
jgi:alkylglycerol monooxygenase